MYFVLSFCFTAAASVGPTKDGARRRDGKPVRRGRGEDDSPKKSPAKNSLRVGGAGRKGRSAELTQRRGTLKRRDRAGAKEARAEAALERKTVYLPEYVGRRLYISLLLIMVNLTSCSLQRTYDRSGIVGCYR